MKKRIVAIGLIIALLTAGSPVNIYATEQTQKDEEIRDTTYNASCMLKELLQDQYDSMIAEIKDVIVDKNYDFSLSMESVYLQQNPFASADMIEYLAAYMSSKKYAKEKGIRIPAVYEIPFITYTMTEVPFEEYLPTKIDEYCPKEGKQDRYVLCGSRYIFEPMTLPVYEKQSDGYYIKTDQTELVQPKIKESKYIDIDIKIANADDIIKECGLNPDQVDDDYKRRIAEIKRLSSSAGINQMINLVIPELGSLSDTDSQEYEKYTENLDDIRKIIVQTALSLKGKIPYEWGGKSRKSGYDQAWWTFNDANGLQKGLDCSGFVQWVYRTSGFPKEIYIELGSTSQILKNNLEKIERDELLPGDVGCTNRPDGAINHTGIYLGNDKWIHCAAAKNTVIISDFAFTQFYRPANMVVAADLDTDKINSYAEEYDNIFNYTNRYIITKNIDEEKKQDYTYACAENDKLFLAQFMYYTAKDAGLNSWIALCEMVLNRVLSPMYPDTVEGVLFDEGGMLSREAVEDIRPTEDMIRIAELVLNSRVKVLNNMDYVDYEYLYNGEDNNMSDDNMSEEYDLSNAVIGRYMFYKKQEEKN